MPETLEATLDEESVKEEIKVPPSKQPGAFTTITVRKTALDAFRETVAPRFGTQVTNALFREFIASKELREAIAQKLGAKSLDTSEPEDKSDRRRVPIGVKKEIHESFCSLVSESGAIHAVATLLIEEFVSNNELKTAVAYRLGRAMVDCDLEYLG